MKPRTFLFCLTLLSAAAAPAQSFDDLYTPTAQVIADVNAVIRDATVRPLWVDGNTFLYRDGESFFRMDVKAAKKTATTREEFQELLEKQKFDDYDPSDESQFSLGRQEEEPSPDGKWVAFIRDNNIWIRQGDAAPVQLSTDGTDGDRYMCILWSPDSRKIAGFRKQVLKERQILLRMSRPENQVQPVYNWLDYAKPGDVLPQMTPALFDVETVSQIPFSTEAYGNQYFIEPGQWSPDSRYFTFEYNRRGHQLYQLVAVDAETGRNRILAEEKTDTFVYYYDLWRYYFEDGRRILWISERDNWRHLYLIDAGKGTVTQLTQGEWNVREIHHVDEKAGVIYMNVNGLHASEGEDPYNKHLVRLELKSGRIKDLTPENANHVISFSPEFTSFVDNASRPDLPPVTTLRNARDGRLIAELHRADIQPLLDKGFTLPEVFCAKGRDGKTDIWGTIYRPFHFDPSKTYPVVEYIYAGPHDSHVDKDFLPYAPRFFRLEELGFIVVCIDGMGTDNRSKDFQDVAWRNLKDAGFPDRILWMQAAAEKYPYMDLSKVGIYGYSAGGQNTLAALLFHPGFYKVGVALCGCHDNRMDKIWWNEQWMGWPIGPWYSESSNVDNAYRLEGDLFIINGEIDDNVDPASSLQVVSELVKHNKNFEQLYLPGHTHNLSGEYITRRTFEFFYRKIKGGE